MNAFFGKSLGATYEKPEIDFKTSTTIWPVDELIASRIKAWRGITGEDGREGSRSGSSRKDADSAYSGTYSIFPAPLAEWIYIRYCPEAARVLDAFAGGPPRGLVASLMGLDYHGVDIRQEALDEDIALATKHGLAPTYHLGDAQQLQNLFGKEEFDFGLTCPPYYDLEVYSDYEGDISNFKTYSEFNDAMKKNAEGYFYCLKPESFLCIVVANFRDKKTKELIDFRGDTVYNFRKSGFTFWQDIILKKRAGSAAVRASMSWRGKKLVPCHENLLVFKKV